MGQLWKWQNGRLLLVRLRDASSKKLAAETGVEGTPVAAAAWVDTHEKTMKGDRTKSAANDPMDVNEMKQSSWSEAEKSGAADTMHKKLLEQMRERMDERFKNEESARKIDLAAMKGEIRQIKLGSRSTACSEASTAVGKGASGTFARPPPRSESSEG